MSVLHLLRKPIGGDGSRHGVYLTGCMDGWVMAVSQLQANSLIREWERKRARKGEIKRERERWTKDLSAAIQQQQR